MAQTSAIVPPKPREFVVMRRRKARRALGGCLGASVASMILFTRGDYGAPLLALVVAAFISGIAAVVLRFVEQPRATVVQRFRREPPVIH